MNFAAVDGIAAVLSSPAPRFVVMDHLIQIARSLRSLLLGSQTESVVLKHDPTQLFLAGDAGVTLDPAGASRLSSEQAQEFLARYACEPDAWLVLVAPVTEGQAAA